MDAQKLTEFEALKEIDFSDPSILFALTSAVVGDVTSLLIVTHYVAALFVGFIILPKVHGFLPRIILWISFLLPIPLILTLGIALAIILSNKLVEFLAITAVLVAITIASVGAAAPATVAAEAGVVGGGAVAAGTGAAAVGAGAATAETAAAGAGVIAGTGVTATGEAAGSAAIDAGVQAAQQGGREVVENAAQQAAKQGEKTFVQKTRERGLKYAQRKLEGRRDQLREELFNTKGKDDQNEDTSADTDLSGENVVDLRGKNNGGGDGPVPL